MAETYAFLIFAFFAVVVLVVGWMMCPLDAEYEIIEEDPCETCLRWSECNGVDEGCPLRRK